MLCSDCFKNYGLKLTAEKIGKDEEGTCRICGSNSGKKLTKELLAELLKTFFEDGSVDIKTGISEPKYRVAEKNGMSVSPEVSFDKTLNEDYELITKNSEFQLRQNTSRLTHMGLLGINIELKEKMKVAKPERGDFEEFEKTLDRIIDCYENFVLKKGTYIYRIRRQPPEITEIENESEYDSPRIKKESKKRMRLHDRFSGGIAPVFYGALDIETCIHEVRQKPDDELILATFKTREDMELLDLEKIKAKYLNTTEIEDINSFVRRNLFLRDYKQCMFLGVRMFKRDFKGIKFISYYSQVRQANHANLAIFGNPVASGKIALQSLNRVSVKNVNLDYCLGPIFRKKKELEEIKKLIKLKTKEMNKHFSGIISKDELKKIPKASLRNFKPNIHSLGVIKRIYKIN